MISIDFLCQLLCQLCVCGAVLAIFASQFIDYQRGLGFAWVGPVPATQKLLNRDVGEFFVFSNSIESAFLLIISTNNQKQTPRPQPSWNRQKRQKYPLRNREVVE